MTKMGVEVELDYQVERETSFAFSIIAARTSHQLVTQEHIQIEPDLEVTLAPYGGGNHQLLRLTAPAGALRVSYRATISINAQTEDPALLAEVPFADVPADILPFLNPSRYCESDKLGDFAWRQFGDLEPGYSRVRAISDWVGENLTYEAGSTNGSSSTTDVLLERAGVCRDFAHVGISLCRALGVPARYVSGYGVGVEPQDFHGFFEAYLGGDWYLFDPTGMTVAQGLARIGYGRDAADAPFATLVGQAQLTRKSVAVNVATVLPDVPAATSTA